jgi:hypothetical protein
VEISIGKEEKKDGKYGKYDDYEIESAARTITEAEEIKADEEKMKYVKECLEEKASASKKAIKSIQDIRDAGNEIQDEDED